MPMSVFFRSIDLMEFFLNEAQILLNLGNQIDLNHRGMNWTQFKDPVSHMCLTGAVVPCWSLTQETAGSNSFNDNYFCP